MHKRTKMYANGGPVKGTKYMAKGGINERWLKVEHQ
jgi:hypothetical protein